MGNVPKKRKGCWWMAIVGGVLLLAAGYTALPVLYWLVSNGKFAFSISHCKQISLSLMEYARDHDGLYPDGTAGNFHSANQVFRELFKAGIVDDEYQFACSATVFRPDRNIGSPPNFEQALMPGECHWMLLKHQSEKSHPRTPVIIENALNATWPPRWDVSVWFSEKRGRAWPDRTVIICRIDGGISMEKLRSDGTLDWHSANNLDEHGKSWIDYLTLEQVAKLEYWDIEEK